MKYLRYTFYWYFGGGGWGVFTENSGVRKFCFPNLSHFILIYVFCQEKEKKMGQSPIFVVFMGIITHLHV